MPIKKLSGRQEVISAEVPFTFADVTGTTFHGAIELPYGARLLNTGSLTVVAASQASVTLDVGDTTVANRYGNDLDMATTGRKALTATDFVTAVEGDIGLTFSAQPTQGSFVLSVQYVVAGRVAFSQGLDFRAAGIRGA